MIDSQELLTRARVQGTPLIDGETVTFLWQGKKAPHLIGDFTGWEAGKSVKLSRAGTSLWIYQTTFPLDTYMEYTYIQGKERLFDPFNSRRITNGLGNYNQYFRMPGSQPTPLVRRHRQVPHGQVTTHRVETDGAAAGKRRTVYLYQPPVEGPVPLVVVWDGKDYYRRARLNYIVDNLIHRQLIRPIALAMLDNGKSARFMEYACNDATLVFLWSQVMPLALNQLNLLDWQKSPGAFGVLGASLGGLMALYTAARLPHIFGKVLSQSGAFSFGGYDTVVVDLLRHAPRLPLRLWLDVGKYDLTGLDTANQHMFALLQEKGYPFESRLYPAGHNFTAWRDDISRGLEYLFGN